MNESGKINYIEIPSRDIVATKRFLGEVFLWTFTDYGPDYTAIDNGGIDGGFFKSDQVASADRGSVLIVLYSSELETTLNKVELGGGEIIKDIFSFPGGRRIHFSDPSGNEYAVWSE